MRMTVVAATALALTLPAVAAQANNFDGVYGGVQIGAGFTSIEQDVNSPNFNGGQEKTKSLSADGVIGGAFVGYGRTLPGNFYIGAEADGSFGGRDYSFQDTDPTNPLTQKIKVGTEWSLSVRPGYVVNEHVMLYGLAGIEWVPVKSTASDNEITFSKTQADFRIGMGAEVSIMGPLTMRVDYTHTFMNDITIQDGFGNSEVNKFSEDKFKLGVAYHF